MQIYRLLKGGAFKLGTAGAYAWAMRVRTETGAGGIRPCELLAASIQANARGRGARRKKGQLRLTSRILRAMGVGIVAGMKPSAATVLQRADEILRNRPVDVAIHVAGVLGVPVNLDQLDVSGAYQRLQESAPADDEIDAPSLRGVHVQVGDAIERAAAGGYGERQGKAGRWSGKRCSFSRLQLAVNEVVRSGKKANYATIAVAIGVSSSTLWRWVNEGHLARFRRQILPWSESPSIDLPR